MPKGKIIIFKKYYDINFNYFYGTCHSGFIYGEYYRKVNNLNFEANEAKCDKRSERKNIAFRKSYEISFNQFLIRLVIFVLFMKNDIKKYKIYVSRIATQDRKEYKIFYFFA